MSGVYGIPFDSELRKCRLCFDSEKGLIYIFEEGGTLRNVGRTICEVLNYTVFLGDRFPPFVCSDCVDKLYEFMAFKVKCDSRKENYELILNEQANGVCKEKVPFPMPVRLVEISTGKVVHFQESHPMSIEAESPVVYSSEEVEEVSFEHPVAKEDYHSDYEEVSHCYLDDYDSVIPAQMVEVVEDVTEEPKKVPKPKKPRKPRKVTQKKERTLKSNCKRKETKARGKLKRKKEALPQKESNRNAETSAPPLELVLREENVILSSEKDESKNNEKNGSGNIIPDETEIKGDPITDGTNENALPSDKVQEREEEVVTTIEAECSPVKRRGRPKKVRVGRPKIQRDAEQEKAYQMELEARKERKRAALREYNRKKIAMETAEEREIRLLRMRNYIKRISEEKRRKRIAEEKKKAAMRNNVNMGTNDVVKQ